MAILTLIRHGQGSFGSENYDRLSPHGQWQATVLGRYFKEAGVRFDHLYCGELVRQRETVAGMSAAMTERADPATPPPVDAPTIVQALDEYPTKAVFAAYMPGVLEVDTELREIFALDRTAAGRDRALSRRVFFPVINAWMADTQQDHESLESFADFCSRVGTTLSEVIERIESGERIAVVTSAGVIAIAVQMALELPLESFARVAWQVHNASVTCLSVEQGNVDLLRFNSTMHLEASGRDDALTWL